MSWRNGVWFEDCFKCGEHHPARDGRECERFTAADSLVQHWSEHFGVQMTSKAALILCEYILAGVDGLLEEPK